MLLKFENLKLNCFTFDEDDNTGIYEFSNGNCTINLVTSNLSYNFASSYEATLKTSDSSDDKDKFSVIVCMIEGSRAYLSLRGYRSSFDRAELNISTASEIEELCKSVEINLPVYLEIKSV